MATGDKSRSIRWAKSLVLSLVIVFLLDGNIFGQGTLEDATNLNQRVVQLYQEGRYREAIPLAERALTISERVLGSKHPQVAVFFNDLAVLYYAQGDYRRAEPLYQRALTIRERALGPVHPDVAKVSTTWLNSTGLRETMVKLNRSINAP